MSQVTDAVAALEIDFSGLKADFTTIQTGIASLQTQIATLTAQLAAAGTLSPADQAALAQVESDAAALKTSADNIAAGFTAPAPTTGS